MIEQITRDIKAALHERVASPLYRVFTLSWLVINWKIPYITFFVSEDNVPSGMGKMEYIAMHLLNWLDGLAYPLASTVAFIWAFPWAANYVYKKDMQFKQARIEQKQEIEKKRLLTVEESVALRAKITQLQDEFEKSVSEKEKEINTLKATVKQQAEEITVFKSAAAESDSPPRSTPGDSSAVRESQESEKSETATAPVEEYTAADIDRIVNKILRRTTSTASAQKILANEREGLSVNAYRELPIEDMNYWSAEELIVREVHGGYNDNWESYILTAKGRAVKKALANRKEFHSEEVLKIINTKPTKPAQGSHSGAHLMDDDEIPY